MSSSSSISLSFPTGFQGPVSFQIILTTSFYNRSSTQNQGSAWLDELQTHGGDPKTGAISFLQAWSNGNFSNEELIKVRTYSTHTPLELFQHITTMLVDGNSNVSSVPSGLGGKWQVRVCLPEFLLPLGSELHWTLNLTSLCQ